jgi:hypothetical protein
MPTWLAETTRRLLDWLRQEPDDPLAGLWFSGREAPPEPEADGVERPWRHRWDHLPKRTAGFGFTEREYREARARAEDVARLTLGDDVWARVRRVGYVDLPSRRFPGVIYRLRVGRRIEVRCAPGVDPPWSQPYLCINPTYPLPEAEFFAHLYLYARDNEDELIRVAAPQPWDQRLGRTF